MASAPGTARPGEALDDATATAARVRAGEVNPTELVDAALARIAEHDDRVNAFTVVLESQAQAEAAAVEAALRRGEDVGLLAGVPVAIKDMLWLRGAPATKGSRALRDHVPDVDSVAVARLRAAGAIVVGKTTNPELGYRGVTESELFGVTRNPVDPSRTAGGSSGGSGAAVAYGAVPLALGSDGGGSIRIPASFCGVAGHKPTDGLVPRGPGFRGWETLAVVGPLARSARDLELALRAMAGYHWSDERSPTGGEAAVLPEAPAGGDLRIAYSLDLGYAPVEPAVRGAFERAVERLRSAGWRLDAAAPEPQDSTPLWTQIAVAEGYAADRDLLERSPELLEPDTRRLIAAGAEGRAADYLDAIDRRAGYTRRWQRFFEDFDVLLTPMMQMTAFAVGILAPAQIAGIPVDPFFDDWCAFCLPANLTGMPATTVPCGRDPHGLPVGLQVMAPRGRDLTTLRVAAACEAALGEAAGAA